MFLKYFKKIINESIIYSDAFSDIGGIETFNRAFLKAADELEGENIFEFKTLSLYDAESDERYIRESRKEILTFP